MKYNRRPERLLSTSMYAENVNRFMNTNRVDYKVLKATSLLIIQSRTENGTPSDTDPTLTGRHFQCILQRTIILHFLYDI